MKRTSLYLVLLFVLSGLYSCQKDEVSQSEAPQGLTGSATLTTLMERVAQSPTAVDNVVDGTSCFSVILPYTCTLNSVQCNVTSADYYQTVQDIKNAYNNDDDIVYFDFPIRLKYRNFQEVTVTSQDQYNSIKAACAADDGFGEIICIDFNYPITITTYDTVSQTPGSVVINSNSQLYTFLDGLNPGLIYNVVYPISMTKAGGENLVCNSNSSLQAGIENVIGICEDDTPVYDTLATVLVSGLWKVSSYIDEDEDETLEFLGYVFTFNVGGTVVAVKNGNSIGGTWSDYVDSGFSKLNLEFNGDVLRELEEDWRVLEYNNNQIKLRHDSGGGGIDYLTFTKI